MAVERLPEVTKKRGVLGWSLIKRVVLSWHWWGYVQYRFFYMSSLFTGPANMYVPSFVILWIAGSNTEMYSSNAIMQLWLRSLGDYPVAQVNYIPTSVSGMGIIATCILGWYSDYGSRPRWHVGIFLSFTAILSGALFLTAPTRAARFAALILNGCQFAGQTVTFAWANDLTRDDDAKRAVVLSSMNMFSVAVYLFWSILFYNTTQAPDWTEGSCEYSDLIGTH